MAKEPRADEQLVVNEILKMADDPEAFVRFAFPWGKQGTPLEDMDGPRDWQLRALREIKDHIKKNRRRVINKEDPELLKMARASGRGIGKSAFLAWIAIWLFSTKPASTVIVSANTEQQLKSTTFPEIRKWATMAINNTWFEHHAMSLRPSPWLVNALQRMGVDDAYWYIQARLWSEENPDAYAGPHSTSGMAVLFDEASGIPACIWPVAQGYFTDRTVHRLWVAISNPRNPSGAFFECFHANRDAWQHETIDAREIKENDQTLYNGIIKEYGPDSDQARVEVYGQFPRQGDYQFMSRGDVDDAMRREIEPDTGAALVMGVDPARFGNDQAVIAFRRGRDARSIPFEKYSRTSTVELSEHVMRAIDRYKPDAVFVEGDGAGGGVVDLLKHYGIRVIEVTSGSGATDKDTYSNHRTEMWGRMRDWLATAALPEDKELADDMAAPLYSYTLKGQLMLESKDKMKRRGFASPDTADALAITFSRTIGRKDAAVARRSKQRRFAKDVDYDIFA